MVRLILRTCSAATYHSRSCLLDQPVNIDTNNSDIYAFMLRTLLRVNIHLLDHVRPKHNGLLNVLIIPGALPNRLAEGVIRSLLVVISKRCVNTACNIRRTAVV